MCRFNEHRGERSISTMLVFVLYVDRHMFKQWNTVFFLMLQLCFSCTDCEKGKVSNSVIFYFKVLINNILIKNDNKPFLFNIFNFF